MQTVHFLRNFLCLVACVGNSGDDWLCAYFKRNVQQNYYIIRQIYRLCLSVLVAIRNKMLPVNILISPFKLMNNICHFFFKCEQQLHMSKGLCSQRNSFLKKQISDQICNILLSNLTIT